MTHIMVLNRPIHHWVRMLRLAPGNVIALVTVVLLLGAIQARGAPPSSTDASASNPSPTGQLEEIVVTAQKRSENLQDVPVSVLAYAANQLAAVGVTGTSDLDILTPGLISAGQAGYAQPHLRGIGTTANGPGVENPIALYVDGVYYSSQSASILALNNIESIEVDRGPQGTLFGRNATGGLIQITTRDPTQAFSGAASLGFGNYNTGEASLYLSGGVADHVAADVALYAVDQGRGYGVNEFNGDYVNRTQDAAFRSKWLFTPASGTEIKVIFDFENTQYVPAFIPAPGTTPLGGPPYTGPTQGMDGYVQPDALQRQGGISVQLKQQLDWAEFMSLTAFRRSYMNTSIDGGLVTDPAYVLNIDIIEPHRQITQEFQLLSPSSSRVTWVAGAYFFYADAKYNPINVSGGLLDPLAFFDVFSEQKSKSAAVYGQATTEVLPATDLTVGLRYTVERRDYEGVEILGNPDGTLAGPPFTDSAQQTFQKPTWRFSLDHKFSDAILGYVSYNRGFKSGGFNDDLVPTTPYAPETLDAYEIGSKADLAAKRLRLNVAAFYYNYKNMQAVTYPAGLEEIYNGAAAHLYGLDLDLTAAVTDALSIKSGVELLHSEFTSFPVADYTTPAEGGGTNFGTFNAKGNILPFSPSWTADVSADYVVPTSSGKFGLNVTYAYNAGWFAEPDNRLHQAAYNLVNASASWRSPNDVNGVRLWGKNLSNSQYLVIIASQSNGDFAQYAPPRTFGISYDRRF
jgi:iron complex outermembrane recepter protein